MELSVFNAPGITSQEFLASEFLDSQPWKVDLLFCK